MAMFTTRIELHDANWDDYQKLHTAMAAAGFSRIITSDDNTTWHMPWAEYDAVGSYSIDQVFTAASNAASSVGKKFAVFVTQAISRKWAGLQKAS